MKRLLEFLLSGCFHEWEIEEKREIYDYLSTTNKLLIARNENPIPCGSRYILRCKKCGNMKSYRT